MNSSALQGTEQRPFAVARRRSTVGRGQRQPQPLRLAGEGEGEGGVGVSGRQVQYIGRFRGCPRRLKTVALFNFHTTGLKVFLTSKVLCAMKFAFIEGEKREGMQFQN